jgi:hypothetical protein
MRSAQNYKIKGSRLNCNGCRIQANEDSLNNVPHETSRRYWNKKMKYLKEKTNKLETNSRNIK